MPDPFERPDEHGSSGPLFTSRRMRAQQRRRRAWAVAIVLLLAAAGGWWWLRSRSGADGAAPAGGAVAEGLAPSDSAGNMAGDEPPPALDASDDFVRGVVSKVSSYPQLASWLVNDDLARRFVISVVEVAHGRSPRSHVRFLAPKTPIDVQTRGGEHYLDPASYRRYDLAAGAVASLDTQGTAQALVRLRPLFEKAYAELGLEDMTWDQTLNAAFDAVLAVRVPDRPLQVRPEAAGYGFVDAGLENESPLAKHFLRMGPENTRRIQDKLRAVKAALATPSPSPSDTAGAMPRSR